MPEIPQQAEPPAVADGRDYSLDPRTMTVSRLAGLVWVAVLAVPTLFVLLLLFFFSGPGAWVWLAGWALLFGALAAWALYWPGLKYRYVSYRVDDRGMLIRRGVVWRSEISVPKSRVQHTDVAQGPLQRRFGVSTLVLHTAGTQHASVSLAGLPYETALAIRDHLIEGGEDDAV